MTVLAFSTYEKVEQIAKIKLPQREREDERDKISGNSGKGGSFPRPWILSDKACLPEL